MPFKGQPNDLPDWVPLLGSGWDAGSDAIRKTLKRSKTARRIDPGRRLKLPYERIEFDTADGARLVGWFVPGAETPSRPADVAIVLHHHYGGQKATVLPWIAWFHRQGWPCLAFDARGHAESSDSPEGRGSFVARREDVRGAMQELRRRGFSRLVAFGQSQGAAALVMAVADVDDVLGVIVDSGPAPDMGTAAWGLAGNMLGRTGKEHPRWRGLLAARIIPGTQPITYQHTLWRSLFRLRRRPLLWLHGGKDDVIPRRWSKVWFDALKTAAWSFVHVPDADHVRTLAVGGDAVEGAVSGFLERVTRPA
jgi:uncharacterized protein